MRPTKHSPTRSLPFVSLGLACLALSSPATGQQFEAQQLLPPWGKDCAGCLAGNRVEVAGDWAFVGAWTKGVLIYRRTSSGWVFHQVIRAVPGESAFPTSISAEADTMVVGAHLAKSPSGDEVGKVHVYELIEDKWVQTQELQPPSLQEFDQLGFSLSLFGDTLAVGVPGVDVTLPGGQVIPNVGAVYVYRRTAPGEPWELEERLLSPAAFLPGGLLGVFTMGISVGLAQDVLAAGAPGDLGAVFLFERDSSGWHRTQILQDQTPDQGDRFGEALAISGTTLVVGESAKDHAGRAFVFERDAQVPGEWGLVQELQASDGWFGLGANDDFGAALDIEGDHIVVGAFGGNYNGDISGTAYLFRRQAAGGWPKFETQRLVSSVPGQKEALGISIAIDGAYIWAGATHTKVKKKITGSAYVFELELGSEYCGAENNSLGRPAHLALTGSEHAQDEELTLSVRDCPPQTVGFFLMAPVGDQGLNQTLGEGRLCLGPGGVTRLWPALSSGPLGILMHTLDSREDVTYPPPGSTWSFQFLYRDPAGGPAGFNLTNAVELTLQ